tara:strand:- start:21 stop:191 length:171 start_codon:yes stop_codon:yes gene_type:complete
MNKKEDTIRELITYMIGVSESHDLAKQNEDPSFKGQGWMTFHLNRLKELIDDDDNA